MKKLLLILMLIPILGSAQETPFLKVIGRAVHLDKELIFKGAVVLSSNFSSYPAEAVSLDQMRTKYDEALQKNGLRITNLVEKPDLYTRMAYEKEGTLYQYETTDLQEFQQFLSTSCFGLQRLNYDTSFTINAEEASKLVAKAIENARINATLTAEGIGKKLGPLMWVEDNNRINTEILQGMYYSQKIGEYLYDITVQFSLEN